MIIMAPGTVSTSVVEYVMCKKILLHMRKVVKIIQIGSQRNVQFVGRPSGTLIDSPITTS